MANNRMFLVHVPTGLAVYLGRRMAWGWYNHADNENIGPNIARLFRVLEEMNDSYAGRQDDFSVALEDVSGASSANGAWWYGPEKRQDGLWQLVMDRSQKA